MPGCGAAIVATYAVPAASTGASPAVAHLSLQKRWPERNVWHVRESRRWIFTVRPGWAGAILPANVVPVTVSVIRAFTVPDVPRPAYVGATPSAAELA